MKIFTKEFLDSLQEKSDAMTAVDYYMNNLGMSFQEAILRFANHHSIESQYYSKDEKKMNASNYKEIIALLDDIIENTALIAQKDEASECPPLCYFNLGVISTDAKRIKELFENGC